MTTDKHVLRSISLPVSRPDGTSWDDFDAIAHAAWSMSTNLANWAMLELFRRDVTRTRGMEKLPSLPPDKKGGLYLYEIFTRDYADRALWDGCTQSAQCVMRYVRRKYKRDRFSVIWRAETWRAHYKYPVPFPVHNRAWRAYWSEEGQRAPMVDLPLPGGRVQVRLDGAGQRKTFALLVDGKVKRGEAALLRRRRNNRVMLKLVAWLPRRQPAERELEMCLRTDEKHFLVCLIADQEVRYWNADHVLRQHMAHKHFLQRVAEDTKYEKRVPNKMRRHIDQAVEQRAARHQDLLITWNHEVSAQVIGLARRQRVARIVFDDSCTTYFAGFVPLALLEAQDMSDRPLYPLYDLRTKLAYKAEEAGIEFVHRPASGTMVNGTTEA